MSDEHGGDLIFLRSDAGATFFAASGYVTEGSDEGCLAYRWEASDQRIRVAHNTMQVERVESVGRRTYTIPPRKRGWIKPTP